MKLSNTLWLLVLIVILVGCHGSKCINAIDENNQKINPVKIYLLTSEEYSSEISSASPILFGDGKGKLVGESRNGEICFSNENEGLLGGYYKVVAPHLVYKDAFKYYSSFNNIPDVIVFSESKGSASQ